MIPLEILAEAFVSSVMRSIGWLFGTCCDERAMFVFSLGYEAASFDICLKQGGAFCLLVHADNADRLVARAERFGRKVELDGRPPALFRIVSVSAHRAQLQQQESGGAA
jgi:hypothetical protein